MTEALEDRIAAARRACEEAPGAIEPRLDLVRALLAAGRAAEAVIPAEQAAATGGPEAVALRNQVIEVLQAGDPTLVALELAAAMTPDDPDAHLSLGDAYAALDRLKDAERHFKAALSLGRAREAHATLAPLYLSVGMLDAAEHHARASLAAPPRPGADDEMLEAMAHQTLAAVSRAKGDDDGADAHLDQAYARRSVFHQPSADAPFTTLILLTRTQGNISYQSLLPPLRSDRVVWYMEHAKPGDAGRLPPYAVVLNAIGDADTAIASQAAVEAFVRGCTRPVMNDPARVRATFRHLLPETLRGIEGVVVPQTARLDAGAIAEQGLAAAALASGVRSPMLVRPVGSHGGAGLFRVDSEEELRSASAPAGAAVYVSAFHDTCSPDGFWRKYRAIFVDRKAFPYHLAISPHWMVHHQSSEMAGDDARVAEEMAFLRDPAAALGARAWAAVEAIGRRLDLDYAGVDFTLTADGKVLVFEANATMLTHVERDDGSFAAKNPFIRPIIEAFQARLNALAAQP